MRLWLTRRLMLGLWPLLSKLLTKHLLKLEAAGSSLETADEGLKKMLADFRKEEFLQARGLRHALPGEPGAAAAGRGAAAGDGRGRLAAGQRPLAAEFQRAAARREKPRSFQMEMEPKLMQGLMHLLEQALTLSQWREAFGAGPVAVEDCAVEQDSPAARKPRYLN